MDNKLVQVILFGLFFSTGTVIATEIFPSSEEIGDFISESVPEIPPEKLKEVIWEKFEDDGPSVWYTGPLAVTEHPRKTLHNSP